LRFARRFIKGPDSIRRSAAALSRAYFAGRGYNSPLNAGFGGNAEIKSSFPYEFNSPRDADGHGTHTSSTAGGNSRVLATGPAAVFGTINGIAPRARIATYKDCWGNNGEGGASRPTAWRRSTRRWPTAST
jgi:hypothetical protein